MLSISTVWKLGRVKGQVFCGFHACGIESAGPSVGSEGRGAEPEAGTLIWPYYRTCGESFGSCVELAYLEQGWSVKWLVFGPSFHPQSIASGSLIALTRCASPYEIHRKGNSLGA